jgi:hypothetical protein
MLVAATILALAISFLAFVLIRKHKREAMPSGWTAITDGNDYGVKVEPDGSFTFPLFPSSIRYVTRGCAGLSGKGIRLRYRIDADSGVKFLGAKDGMEVSVGPFLHFQRKGDDWSGTGAMETFRWWLAAAPPLTPGEHEIVGLFGDDRGAVERANNSDHAAEFSKALSEASRVGFTWPNAEGKGHGLYATGKSRFTLLEFAVE